MCVCAFMSVSVCMYVRTCVCMYACVCKDPGIDFRNYEMPSFTYCPLEEELDKAMLQFAQGLSLSTQRRDKVLLRHCLKTLEKIARDYYEGLPQAIERVRLHNQQAVEDLEKAGARQDSIQRCLLPEPEACRETFEARQVQ